MKLLLERKYKKSSYTIGKLYIDGKYFCDTIEDIDRNIKQTDTIDYIKRVKIPRETAIPIGTYKITLNVKSIAMGNKPFYKEVCGGNIPRLLNVPGFDGILIHCGNTEKDSAGCIIVGKNKAKGKVLESKETFKELYKKLKTSSDITIRIV